MVRYLKTIFLFMLIFMCFQGYIPAKANTGTDVSGTIYQNTTWTRAGSPYYLTGDIQVNYGVKLTVEPGVTIEGNNRRIMVDGDFEAVGNPNLKIILNDVIFNDPYYDPVSASIHLENADIIQSGNKSWGLITNLILKDSRIFNLSNPLTLFYPPKDVFIERNVFINSCGINVRTYLDAKVNILNNVFYNYTDYAVSNLDTTGSSETIVANNSFLKSKNNGSYALLLPAGYPTAKMTAINNYWGTTDETAIKKMIFDKNNEPSSGSYINYNPYLLAPDKNTPYIKLVPPEKPIVYDVTDKSEYITGNAEKLSVIKVVNENNDLIGETTAGQNGDFRVNIKRQNAGSKLYVTATDDWFNKSESTIITVKKFIAVPTVNPVNNKSTLVTGKTEPALIVTVKIGTKAYTAKADGMGNYNVTIPVQNTGTTISISANDSEGNVSSVKTTTVIRAAPNMPRVNPVNNKSTLVTGEAEPKAIITVKIGTKVYKAKVDELGNYKVTIPVQNTGTTISVTATDSKENVSSVMSTKVIRAAPNMPRVNPVNNKSILVKGEAEPKAIITVIIGTKVYKAKVDGLGKYKVTIPVQNTGTTISVTATDSKENVSSVMSTKVIRAAPNMPTVNAVNNKSTLVAGITEPKAIVTLKIGTKTYTAKANAKGNYKVTIPVQNTGTVITIKAKDNKGNVSAVISTKVIRIAPNMPTVNKINNKSTLMAGKTEPKATITVKIGKKAYTAKANVKGNYKVTIPKQRIGTKVYVSAKDKKGRISVTKIVTVSRE